MKEVIQSRIKAKTTELKRALNPECPDTIQMEVVNYCNHKCEFRLISHLDRPTKGIDEEIDLQFTPEAAEVRFAHTGPTMEL